MYAVLYTTQFEPITVLDVSQTLFHYLARGDRIALRVTELMPLSGFVYSHDRVLTAPRLKTVIIFGERIRRMGCETLLLFTEDDEYALLLKSEFLPGQRRELHERELGAFAAGFCKAVREFGC